MPDELRNFTVRIDPELLQMLHELSERNGRSVNAEAISAIRRHLAAPPVVIEAAPPLPAEDLIKNPPRKRTGGKPFSGGYKPRSRRKKPAEGEAPEGGGDQP